MSSCEVNHLVECPRSTDRRSTGRRSLVHRSYNSKAKAQKLICICHVVKISWAALDLEDAHLTSRSSRSYERASRTSRSSTSMVVGWSVLHLDDEPYDVVSPRGSGWQSTSSRRYVGCYCVAGWQCFCGVYRSMSGHEISCHVDAVAGFELEAHSSVKYRL